MLSAMKDTPDIRPSWDGLAERVAVIGLRAVGGFVPTPEDGFADVTQAVVLLAPQDDVFWPMFTASAEYLDGAPDPLDRWSRREIGGIACALGAKAVFPFSGPPWRPFIGWAKRTGRIHASPVGLLVEAEAGLFVSLRGALAFKTLIDLPAPSASPCETCAEKPCLTACPVGALDQGSYDTEACREFLDSAPGRPCRDTGCAVRRACPLSRSWPRPPAQSAFHMAAFHG